MLRMVGLLGVGGGLAVLFLLGIMRTATGEVEEFWWVLPPLGMALLGALFLSLDWVIHRPRYPRTAVTIGRRRD